MKMECVTKLKNLLKEKSLREGWFWCKTVYVLYDDIIKVSLTDIYKDFVKNFSTDNTIGVLHLTQVFSNHLDYDYIQKKYDDVGNVIILRSLMHCEEIDVQIAEVFGQIENIRNQNSPQFLYDS
ncbi:hypothetical protein NQ314_019674 [Rhamnusium bicolor]|uniref:Uncharacterized protein n=1 Tax=Rhamnusium bicolor TaxID=1586634 RepID=A0AAV8WNC1_9CUCU|nr:hypothetical protein NQ314_019674 [Rhamnusium bicolor]